MRKKMNLKKLCLLGTLCLFLGVGGCSASPTEATTASPKADVAKTFVEKVFVAPLEKVSALEKEIIAAADSETTAELEVLLLPVLTEAFGDTVSESKFADTSSKLFQSVMGVQIEAVEKKATYVLDSVNVTEFGENNYRYNAVITVSNVAEKAKYSGSIQFDKEGKINYFVVEPTT